jgi:hypothetical protein
MEATMSPRDPIKAKSKKDLEEINPYNLIYDAAIKAKSKKDLETKLNEVKELLKKSGKKYAIDDKKMDHKTHTEFTVAAKLAYKGGHGKQIKWLRELEKANSNEIAKAYAMAGSYGMVKKYRKEYKADVNEIVKGYILGGKTKHVDFYLKELKADPKVVIHTYALLGNEEKVAHYATLYKDKMSQLELLIQIAHGYAEGGHHSLAVLYYALNPHCKKPLLNAFIHAYAKSGDHHRAQEYLTNSGHNEEAKESIVKGFAEGGHHLQAEARRKQFDIEPAVLAQAYKVRGDQDKYKEYNKTKEVFEFNKVLDNLLEKREKHLAAKTSHYKGFIPFFQKNFERQYEAIDSLKKALNGEEVKLKKHLFTLKDGELGKELDKLIKSGQASKVAGVEVKTITDFVKQISKNAPETNVQMKTV